MRKFLFVLSILTILGTYSQSQVFTEIHSGFRGVIEPVAGWINTKNNHANAFLAGEYYSVKSNFVVSQYAKIVAKDKFNIINSPFPALSQGSVAIADYDHNGDDDIIITGVNKSNQLIMKLYRNNGNRRFSPVNEPFAAVSDGSLDWGDYDHDGDLDILVTGKRYNNQLATVIYQNNKGLFSEKMINVPGVYHGSARWGDFDNDGYLDILITGNIGEKPFTAVYKNENGNYVRLAQSFYPLKNSDCAWADFDGDKDLDFVISGEDADGFPVFMLYSNDGRAFFREVPVAIRGLKNCTIDVADYDNDGAVDILLTGESMERPYTLVYKNNLAFDFENVITGLPGVSNGIALWGDYDGDGDQDILLAGITICYEFIGSIYRNNINPAKKQDTGNSIFINSTLPNYDVGPFYYYVFSSCYCNPSGNGKSKYHLYISNIHLEKTDYDLNYKFNDILVKTVPNWGKTDSGHRTSNAFLTKNKAAVSRSQIIKSYKATGFIVHYINW